MGIRERETGGSAASGRAAQPESQGSDLRSRALQLRAAQRRASARNPGGMQETAARGMRGEGGELPHLERIQQSFGKHDVSGVRAHRGSEAQGAARAIDAEAYTQGGQVAFGENSPSLHTAAHEAAHAVQQRGGLQLKGGVGAEGDAHERHADEVADLVVSGSPAEKVLDRMAPGGARGPASPSVQRKVVKGDAPMEDVKPKKDAKNPQKPEQQANEEEVEEPQANDKAKDEVQDDGHYQSVEEVMADMAGLSSLVGLIVNNFGDKVGGVVSAALKDNEEHTLEEIAATAVPSVFVGEEHDDPRARQFVLAHMEDFAAAGITNAVIEYDGSTPFGSCLKMCTEDEELKKTIPDDLTFQGIMDLARTDARVFKLLPEIMVSRFKCDIPLAEVAMSAIKMGMRVICGDFTPPMMKQTDKKGMQIRDASFAKELAGIAAGGEKAILLVGHAHLQGIQQALKGQVPNAQIKFDSKKENPEIK